MRVLVGGARGSLNEEALLLVADSFYLGLGNVTLAKVYSCTCTCTCISYIRHMYNIRY